jgi:site-specific recombinase XerD
MTIAEEYLKSSRLFRRLKNGIHGQLVELYAARLVEVELSRQGTWRSLNVVRDLLDWMARHRTKLTKLDERMVERYLRHQAAKKCIQLGDRAALKRWLLALRAAGTIAPAAALPRTPHEQIFAEFGDYLRSDCGLSAKTIVHHLPAIRRFLFEVCPGDTSDLGEITQEQVIRYIERHTQDWSPSSSKAMCWSLRAFLKYHHHTGSNPRSLGGCVPSIRRWKLASLPTYLAAAQVQKVLDGCDRACVTGRRNYAILMLLSRLGLRADEVATLTLDDVDWGAGEILVRAKGRQRASMPIPLDVGEAVVAYLRDGRPRSSCRELFLRSLAPHIGFRSGSAVTMIAKTCWRRSKSEPLGMRTKTWTG